MNRAPCLPLGWIAAFPTHCFSVQSPCIPASCRIAGAESSTPDEADLQRNRRDRLVNDLEQGTGGPRGGGLDIAVGRLAGREREAPGKRARSPRRHVWLTSISMLFGLCEAMAEPANYSIMWITCSSNAAVAPAQTMRLPRQQRCAATIITVSRQNQSGFRSLGRLATSTT
jgi:hypothetical protein